VLVDLYGFGINLLIINRRNEEADRSK